ncbi:TPA: hypothetical protein ACIAQ7_002749 [Salmonella enterica subsp. enterica serovar Waycross]
MINLLIDAIKNRLEHEVFHDLLVQGPPYDETDSDIKLFVPTIFKGYLPPKSQPSPDKPPEFPHVIIRPTEGGMQPETDEVKVKFLLGGFCEDHTGYEWVMALLERMMFHFQEKPLLEEKFLFQGDIRWRMFDDQPYPYWITEATGTWLVLKPQNIQPQEFI